MRLAVWALRVFLFFTLFAFALNNEHEVTLHWFFGYQWRTPLVIVVLVALATGAALGVLAMVPNWWRHRQTAKDAPSTAAAAAPDAGHTTTTPSEFTGDQPPRIGL